jgi:hypothetical protein
MLQRLMFWKETVITYLKVLFWNSLEDYENSEEPLDGW